MSNINQLYEQVSQLLNTDNTLYRKLQSNLISIVSDASVQAMNSDQGYCFKFAIRSRDYRNLLKLINLTEQDLQKAFTNDWGSAAMRNHMHADPYYQTFLFLLYLGIHENNPKITESAMACMLFKLWNGRKTKFFQYCNKDIMKYVTNYMCSRKHLANKHDTPYELIQNYFVPTLLNKYADVIIRDNLGLKRIFEQSYTRVRQLFVYRTHIDIHSGEKVSDGGLLPLYMKAKEEGKSIGSITVRGDEESLPQFADYMSASDLDEIINKTVEKIVMNPNKQYSDVFVENLRKQYRIKKDVIEKLVRQIHNHEYHDNLHDVYSIMLSQAEVSSRDEICSPQFTETVKKRIIASKNNRATIALNNKLMELLEDMLQKTIQRSLSEYSNVFHIQLRKMLIRVLIYNLRSSICR